MRRYNADGLSDMIFIQVLAYTVFAALGTIAAEALEAKLGQHLGMGVIAWMTSWLAGRLAGLVLPSSEGFVFVPLHWLLAGVGVAFVCGAASFLVYTVSARQALIIGVSVGIGHVLLSMLTYWMVSSLILGP